MIDFFGHIGYLFIAAGMVTLAMKNKIGWLLRFTGEAIWAIIGVALGLTSIWMWGTLFLVLDIAGFIAWCAKEAKENQADAGN